MKIYSPRKIEFREIIEVENWKIKVYTITMNQKFSAYDTYKQVILKLANWLNQKNSFDSSNDKIGFLIIHEGNEGVFSLVNWWVGKNMLNTHIYISVKENPTTFKKISGDGLAPCIWELEVIYHEKMSWTENILKKESPDFKSYLEDTITKKL